MNTDTVVHTDLTLAQKYDVLHQLSELRQQTYHPAMPDKAQASTVHASVNQADASDADSSQKLEVLKQLAALSKNTK